MLKGIIVAHDNSELAREGFAYALMLAKALGVPVIGLRVIEPVTDLPVMPDPAAGIVGVLAEPWDRQRFIEQDREQAQQDLSELAEFARQAGVEFHPKVIEGPLLDSLRQAADPTDLLIVGMKGRFAPAGLGTSTRTLVVDGPCPVMVVSGPLREFNRFLVAFDASAQSRRAVPWAVDAAEMARWPLTIAALEGDQISLDDSLQLAQELAPDATVIHWGEPGETEAEQIEHTIEHTRTALLVMGAYRHSRIHQFLFGGSTTARVLSRAQAPVVLVH